MAKHLDVIIIGAGLSGIAAAHYLQEQCPTKDFGILEARDRIGGTWDLFTFPGIRSDASMLTMSYSFRPWTKVKTIVGGKFIREYLLNTAQTLGIENKIYFHHQVVRASWSSKEAVWSLEVKTSLKGEEIQTVYFTCNFLFVCAGYYKYEHGFLPDFNGIDRFQGNIIHPQQWPQDLSYAGKRIIVIGSGATAVTLVPSLAKEAKQVTMLQRSPSYVISLPSHDIFLKLFQHLLPKKMAYHIARWANITIGTLFYLWTRNFPSTAKHTLITAVHKHLGKDYDIKTHFTPLYNPWDQRLCVTPDADFFNAIQEGKVTVITDEINTFTENGLKLTSGRELDADIIVTATGLIAQFIGGIELTVDGVLIDQSKEVIYKGVMINDVPNLVYAFGYINNSWTLKIELTCNYVCRLLNYMTKHGFKQVTPQIQEKNMITTPLFEDFTPGYVQREIVKLPKQGSKLPWRGYQNYFKDLWLLRLAPLKDKALKFF